MTCGLRVSPETANRIRELAADGMRRIEVAAELGVSYETVRYIGTRDGINFHGVSRGNIRSWPKVTGEIDFAQGFAEHELKLKPITAPLPGREAQFSITGSAFASFVRSGNG